MLAAERVMTTAVYETSQIKRRKRSTKAEVEERREALFDIVFTGKPMTVRQTFYQGTVRYIVEKAETGYDKVQRDLTIMRRTGESQCSARPRAGNDRATPPSGSIRGAESSRAIRTRNHHPPGGEGHVVTHATVPVAHPHTCQPFLFSFSLSSLLFCSLLN